MTGPATQAGFTLIEAMVAMVILGIASVGIVRAAEAHIDTLHALERRAAAQWVAENTMSELALRAGAEGGTGMGAMPEVEMLGWRWRVNVTLAGSEDPDLQLATVRVASAVSGETLVSLRGFVDRGTITR